MKKSIIKKCLFIGVIVIILMVVASIMIKYDVEGEKELPFTLTKIFLVSTVDGDVVDDPNNIWNINVTQVNDLYFYVDKTTSDNQTIKNIKIDNIQIIKKPKKGVVKMLRPTGEINDLYSASKENYLETGLDIQGSTVDDLKSLEISNVGGVFAFRFSVNELGAFVSNEINQEITYDGKLLSNLGVSVDEIKFDVNLDITITTSENVSYKGTIYLNLPMDEVIEEGSCSMEIGDFTKVIFKRI